MSDSAQILAAKIDWTSTTERAALVLAWLVEQGVIEAMPTDSGLGQLAHRPGPKVRDAVVAQRTGVSDFRELRTNGMELRHTLRPELQMGGDEMPSFRCPSCRAELDEDTVLPLLEALGSPFEPVPEVACPRCHARRPVHDLTVEGGVFANLVLRFWNWWPLTKSFIAQVEEKCGAPVALLYEHL